MSAVLALTAESAAAIRAEIARSGGNEVCFVAEVTPERRVVAARAVARGHASAVLAAAADAAPGMVVLHNHPSGELTPSRADLEVGASLYARGLGLAIIDNAARELYVVVEPPRARGLEPLDPSALEALLAPGGPISKSHTTYEDRPSQRAMAALVASLYNEGGIGLAEAGTGTGKSIAYLVPAIAWSVANDERTIVSTNTINLQEQLVGKDLPFLRRSLGLPFRFALVKGRHNYVSIRRAKLAAAGQSELFETTERSELSALMTWLSDTRDGSLQELPFEPSPQVWEEVVSDADACLRTRCPHFEQCFYQRARRDAAAADVLVVNHHVLFSDLAVRRAQDNYTAQAVLPPYRRVILDEAHNLEDAATSHLGAVVTRRGVMRLLARLDRRGRGALTALEMRVQAQAPDLLIGEALLRVERLRDGVQRARERGEALFDQLALRIDIESDGVLRLRDGFADDDGWRTGAGEAVDALLMLLGEIARGMRGLRQWLTSSGPAESALEESLLEVHGLAARVDEMAAALRLALAPGRDPFPLVRWLERRGGSRDAQVAARAAPIELADALRDSLFERVDTAVLTSATLSTRDGFDFIRSRLGLSGLPRVREAVHASPFAFETQALVGLPIDLPRSSSRGGPPDPVIAEVAETLARLSDGGWFLLFTSYASLRAVAASLRARRVDSRWPLFVQGEAPRSRLLAEFASSGHGLLLGVASFWEGVDVPGEPLRGLLIPKLPFRVPTEPLTAARTEAIEESGGNSFAEYMLPHAVLRLKQGFGRLIRSRSDRGAVVILDHRIRERGYGRSFLHALPPAPVRALPWTELVAELRRFYTQAAPHAEAVPRAVYAGGTD